MFASTTSLSSCQKRKIVDNWGAQNAPAFDAAGYAKAWTREPWCIGAKLNDAQFKQATWDWVQGIVPPATVVSTWGPIGGWDVRGVKTFDLAFSVHRNEAGAYMENGNSPFARSCCTLPVSPNGFNHPTGCPGAVFSNGAPSSGYCQDKSPTVRTPWWSECCDWDSAQSKCMPKTTNGCVSVSLPLTSAMKLKLSMKYKDISQWITSSVTSLYSTFYGASEMNADLSGWDIAKVVTLSNTFRGAAMFDGTGVESWDVAKVVTLSSTFNGAAMFAGTGMESWDTSSVINMDTTFREASVMNVDVSGWNVAKVTDLYATFHEAVRFTGVGLDLWNNSVVKRMETAFGGASSMNADLSGFDVSNVKSLSATFQGATRFTGSGLEGWVTTSVTDLRNTFHGASMIDVDLSGWNVAKVETLHATFYQATLFRGAGLDRWNTSSITTLHSTFRDASSMDADLGNWSVAKVTTLFSTFQSASLFKGRGLEKWNTAAVTTLQNTFNAAGAVTMDCGAWDVSNVTSLSATFYKASRFVGSDLNKWKTGAVSNMYATFSGASAMNSVLTKWDIRQVLPNAGTPTQPSKDQVIKNAPGVGGWGGYCTCPSGGRYGVGDENNGCGSIACDGGTSGECFKFVNISWTLTRVICAPGAAATGMLDMFANTPSLRSCSKRRIADNWLPQNTAAFETAINAAHSGQGYNTQWAADKCTSCPPGYHLSSGSCSQCDPGTFSPNEDASLECATCVSGTFSSEAAATSCTRGVNGTAIGGCAAGTFGPAGQTEFAAASCTACVRGQYVADQGQTSCLKCPSGKWQALVGNATCIGISCSAGEFGPLGQTNATRICSTCPSGKFQNLPGQPNCGGCTIRQKIVKDVSSGLLSCEECEPGQVADAARKNCICDSPCRPGSFGKKFDKNDPKSCTPCPAGKFYTAYGARKESECSVCPQGRWSSTEGAVSLDTCTKCVAGQFGITSGASSSAMACRSCITKNLEYQNQAGTSNCKSTPCEPGMFGAPPNTTSPSLCSDCPAGFYSSVRGITVVEQCSPCPAGTFGGKDGQDSEVGGCKPCAAGRANALPGQGNASACKACAAGYFQEKPGSALCRACGPGRYNTHTTQVAQSACQACTSGHFSAVEGRASTCESCPEGRWSPSVKAKTIRQCKLCRGGTFSNTTGATTAQCSGLCPPGKYSDDGYKECLPCRKGEIAPKEGSVECTKCEIEETTARIGDTECICGAEKFRANDAERLCKACSRTGMDCSVPGTTVASLKIEVGFWRADDGTMSVLPCPVPEACVGSVGVSANGNSSTTAVNTTSTNSSNATTCVRTDDQHLCKCGQRGPLCAVCDQNYTRFSTASLCSKCPENLGVSILWSMLFILLTAFCLWLFIWISRQSQGGSIRPVINAWQTMSVVLLTSNDWPEAVKWVQKFVLQTVNLDVISLLSPSCLGVPLNFYRRFILGVSGSFFLVGAPWLVSVLAFWRRRAAPEKWETAKAHCLHDSILLVLLIYMLVTAQAFYHFRCQRVESSIVGNSTDFDDTWYLMADMSIVCYDETWWRMTVFVVIVIAVFSIGAPLTFAYVLFKRRHLLADRQIDMLLGMLYKPYKPEFFYWESVVISFKLVLLVGLVFTDQASLYQHAAVLVVCVAQLFAQAWAKPYRTATSNALQYMGTFLTFTMSFGGMLMQNMKISQREASQRLFGVAKDTTEKEYEKQIAAVHTALEVVLFCVIVPSVVVLVYRQWSKRKESKVMVGRFGKKIKRHIYGLVVCCGCSTTGMRAYLAAAREEYRLRLEAEESGAGEESVEIAKAAIEDSNAKATEIAETLEKLHDLLQHGSVASAAAATAAPGHPQGEWLAEMVECLAEPVSELLGWCPVYDAKASADAPAEQHRAAVASASAGTTDGIRRRTFFGSYKSSSSGSSTSLRHASHSSRRIQPPTRGKAGSRVNRLILPGSNEARVGGVIGVGGAVERAERTESTDFAPERNPMWTHKKKREAKNKEKGNSGGGGGGGGGRHEATALAATVERADRAGSTEFAPERNPMRTREIEKEAKNEGKGNGGGGGRPEATVLATTSSHRSPWAFKVGSKTKRAAFSVSSKTKRAVTRERTGGSGRDGGSSNGGSSVGGVGGNEDSQVAGDIELSELRVDSESETAPPRTGRRERSWSCNPVDHLTKKDFDSLDLANEEQEEPTNHEGGAGDPGLRGDAEATVGGDAVEDDEARDTVGDAGEEKTTEEDGDVEGTATLTSAGLRRDEVHLVVEL